MIIRAKLVKKVIYFIKFSKNLEKYKKRYLLYIKNRNVGFKKWK